MLESKGSLDVISRAVGLETARSRGLEGRRRAKTGDVSAMKRYLSLHFGTDKNGWLTFQSSLQTMQPK